jgi:drug/metabolite transporter (DMT)-like permease
MFLVLILYLAFAISFFVGKLSVGIIDPILVIAIRMLIAGSVLLLFCLIKKIKLPDIKVICILSIWHIAFPYCLEFMAFEYASASSVAFIYNLTPLITGIIERILYHKKLSSRQWVAIFIGFMAATLAAVGEIKTQCQNITDAISLITSGLACFKKVGYGEILVLLSVVSSAWSWVYINKLTKNGYSVTSLNATAMFGGGIFALVPLINSTTSEIAKQLNFQSWAIIISLLVMGNLVGYNLYGSLLQKYSATFLALCGSMTPLMVCLLEWLFLGQKPSINLLLASFVMAIAIKMFLYKLDQNEQTTKY